MVKYIIASIVFFSLSLVSTAQDIEHYYELIKKLDTQLKRKMNANELMIDDHEKYLIVNYGNKPTYIIVYSFDDFNAIATFRLSNWVDFSGAYVDYAAEELYIKESRYSSDYYKLNITTGENDLVECSIAPKGCQIIEPEKSKKTIFTSDKGYYVAINKKNAREVKVYSKK